MNKKINLEIEVVKNERGIDEITINSTQKYSNDKITINMAEAQLLRDWLGEILFPAAEDTRPTKKLTVDHPAAQQALKSAQESGF